VFSPVREFFAPAGRGPAITSEALALRPANQRKAAYLLSQTVTRAILNYFRSPGRDCPEFS